MYAWVISSPGDGIVVLVTLSQHNGIGRVPDYPGHASSSAYWSVGPCLHFLEVDIAQFVDLRGSSSGLVVPHLSDALVGVVVVAISVLVTTWVVRLPILLSGFVHVAKPVVDFGHLARHHAARTIVSQ